MMSYRHPNCQNFSNGPRLSLFQNHYRLISLLNVMYKLFERLILQRIQPLIEAATPGHQAGFHKHRSCIEQVMALTTHIEAFFYRQLKTGVVFVDLSVAYGTVWRDGLMLKFMRTVCFQTASFKCSSEIRAEQMVSIKQWFTASQHFSSGVIQPIHVRPSVFLLESVPVL
jgi:hypothetical protein